MKGIQINSIPFPANQIIIELLEELEAIDSELLLAFYVVGSIPLDDFYREKSDIDFVAICKYIPNAKITLKLNEMHQEFKKLYPKPDLSGCYITKEILNSEIAKSESVVTYHEGSIRYGKLDVAPIVLFEFQKYSKCIYNKDAKIDYRVEICIEEVNLFMSQNINTYWTKWLADHRCMYKKWVLLFLFPRFTEWCVLGTARQIYTLLTGEIASKKKAGEFCLSILPIAYSDVLNEAIKIRIDERTYPFVRTFAIRPSLLRTRQSLAFVNYSIKYFNELYRVNLSEAYLNK